MPAASRAEPCARAPRPRDGVELVRLRRQQYLFDLAGSLKKTRRRGDKERRLHRLLVSPSPCLLVLFSRDAPQHQAGVIAAKPEGVGHGNIDGTGLSLIGYVA